MRLALTVLIAAAGLLFIASESFAYTEKFEFTGSTLDREPRVCALEPDLPNHAKSILRETRGAIDEWRNVLQSYERNKESMAKWDIRYEAVPLQSQKEFEYSKCNIIISFKPRPATEPTADGHTVGTTQYLEGAGGKSVLITIYYLDVKRCESGRDEQYIYYKPCYGDDVILAATQANVVRHELGHAFGLGHYVSDDPKVHQAWTKHGAVSPSIMTPYMHGNPIQQKITQRDVEAVRSVYGSDGFPRLSSQHVVSVKVDSNTHSSKPDPITTQSVPPWVKENARWWSSGDITDDDFVHGIQHLIKLNMIKVPAHMQDPEQIRQIPSWVRTAAKWWAEGNTTDEDFLRAVEFLVRHGIIRV